MQNKRKICIVTGSRAEYGILYWLMQRISYPVINKYADFVLVTSEPDVNKFITCKRSASNVIVVKGGVDISEALKYRNTDQLISVDKRIYDACFIGRLHPQKGVLELIDIWQLLCKKSPKSKLVIIGDGELQKQVQKKIQILKLQDNISMVGFKDGKEKEAIFRNSKIVLHPAIYDSGGMAAAEAMAWGLPGVSFDLEALKTYYPKGIIKTSLNDYSRFAENILRMLDDQDLYKQMSGEAYDLIVEQWDWRMRSQLLYKKIFEV